MTGFKESPMIRMPFLLALSILAIAAGNLNAQFKPVQGVTGEVRGIVKSVDGDKNTVTVAVDGALFVKEQTVLIDKDARYQPCLGKAKAAADLKIGTFVILFTAERNGKVVVIDLGEDKPAKEKAAKEKNK
jgi:hypothetical protein